MWTLFTVDVNLLWKFWLFSISMEYRYNIGSLGAILLLGKRENLTWPWRQSLQGEFPFYFSFFLCFLFRTLHRCFVFFYEQITPTFCDAMAAFTSALNCALCEVSPKNQLPLGRPEKRILKTIEYSERNVLILFQLKRWNWITSTREHT